MLIRIFVVLLLYGSIIGSSIGNMRQNNRKEKTVCAIILICSAYCAVSFILKENWPNVDDLINMMFARQLRWVLDALGAPAAMILTKGM
ncbi:hypothetical protein [Paenibacillus thalictri]|uniref:Uncharacterized protein n=1 Tax=Paenibacillus thalictri TaxID=2527873 RepID=A0A4Q9DVM1_9BACL|nr:hypothetical protein [Paenibacillus thalictri]TBL79843.1 hypothetical protein EYB31_09595 [Paenibacillus thalictri]